MNRAQSMQSAAETVCGALVRPGIATLALGTDGPAEQLTLQHPVEHGPIAMLLPRHGRDRAAPHGVLREGGAGVLEITDRLVLGAGHVLRSVSWITGTVEHLPVREQRRTAVGIAEARPNELLLDIGHCAELALFHPAKAVVATVHGVEVVTSAALRHADADPFCLLEDAWLTHLESAHPALLTGLSRRLPRGLRGRPVRPVAVDRFGITLRVGEPQDGPPADRATGPRANTPEPRTHAPGTRTYPTGTHSAAAPTEVRIPFARTARTPQELGRAVRTLARCGHPLEVAAVR